jgi:hypothetical protein
LDELDGTFPLFRTFRTRLSANTRSAADENRGGIGLFVPTRTTAGSPRPTSDGRTGSYALGAVSTLSPSTFLSNKKGPSKPSNSSRVQQKWAFLAFCRTVQRRPSVQTPRQFPIASDATHDQRSASSAPAPIGRTSGARARIKLAF